LFPFNLTAGRCTNQAKGNTCYTSIWIGAPAIRNRSGWLLHRNQQVVKDAAGISIDPWNRPQLPSYVTEQRPRGPLGDQRSVAIQAFAQRRIFAGTLRVLRNRCRAETP